MKKIAFIGAHGAGKTTLAYHTAAHLKTLGKNVDIVPERARFSPFGINENMEVRTSFWCVADQIKLEMEAEKRNLDYLICDRTTFDTFLYCDEMIIDKNNLPLNYEVMKAMANDWLDTYDKIYRVNSELQLLDDKVRSTDQQFFENMQERFKKEFIKTDNDLYFQNNIIEDLYINDLSDLKNTDFLKEE